MRWFGWLKRRQQDAAAKKSKNESGSADTFVEATGGGWDEPPKFVASDGGSQSDFVTSLLEQAAKQAQSVKVGEEFIFTITDIPRGISSPHEIVFGLMMLADEYGLECGPVVNEEVWFIRVR